MVNRLIIQLIDYYLSIPEISHMLLAKKFNSKSAFYFRVNDLNKINKASLLFLTNLLELHKI